VNVFAATLDQFHHVIDMIGRRIQSPGLDAERLAIVKNACTNFAV